ncbi:MAG: MATE family efflux transporter [Candidatus Thermoplasmatota archaeon]|nr:MATE family efflux transporter [Candidatus Thermoplasmatota archaeon]
MDSVRREVLGLAVPAMGSNVLRLLVTTVDMIMVGRLGPIEIGAVGTSNILVFLFQAIMIAVSNGAMVVVAYFYGKREYSEANEAFSESAIVSILLGVVMGSIGFFFGKSMLSFMTDSEAVLSNAESYIDMLMPCLPFMFFGFLCSHVFKASGDAITPLYLDGIANVINIILDYIFIFGVGAFPSMGVAGAALASSVAFVINAFLYSILFLSKKRRLRIFLPTRIAYLRDVFYYGFPTGIEQIAAQISNFIYTAMVGSLGEIALAAHVVGTRAEAFSFMPGFGYYTSSSVLVGQGLGAGDVKKARRGAMESLFQGILLTGVLGLILVIFPRELSMIFTNEPGVIELSRIYLILMGVSQVTLAMDFAMRGALRASGNTTYPMWITIIGRFVVRLGVAYLLGFVLEMGLFGIWLGMMADMFFKGILEYVKFIRTDLTKAKISSRGKERL